MKVPESPVNGRRPQLREVNKFNFITNLNNLEYLHGCKQSSKREEDPLGERDQQQLKNIFNLNIFNFKLNSISLGRGGGEPGTVNIGQNYSRTTEL